MNNKFIYYELHKVEKCIKIPLPDGYKIFIYHPKLYRLNLHSQIKLIYLFWYIFTKGRFSIYYVYDEANRIIHFSHIMPKIFKYSFIPQYKDYHIGPCWTHECHRGKNIYPSVLSKICEDYSNKDIYIFTERGNISSQKGIKKVGFHQFAYGFKTKLLGIYKVAGC